jgi:hypothetical protein
MGMGGQRFSPGKETWYPLCRTLGGPQGRSDRVQKASSPPGFDPQNSFWCSSWKHLSTFVGPQIKFVTAVCFYKLCLEILFTQPSRHTPTTKRCRPAICTCERNLSTESIQSVINESPSEGPQSKSRFFCSCRAEGQGGWQRTSAPVCVLVRSSELKRSLSWEDKLCSVCERCVMIWSGHVPSSF